MVTKTTLTAWFTTKHGEAAFAELYERELPRIYNFFRYRVGDSAVAEDLTSITFEKAWRNRHRYRRNLAKFSTWLYTIARRVAIDHYRQNKAELPLEHAHHVTDDSAPEASAQQQDDQQRLFQLLQTLPKREQELIALKYGACLTNREIARATKLRESNVAVILHRTIGRLRKGWENER